MSCKPRLMRASMATSRTIPHSLEAEESLLGAMLMSSTATLIGMETCSFADFYRPANGHIFSAMCALVERDEAIDAVTVSDELKRNGTFTFIGDPTIFITLQANTPSIANARHYATIISEMGILRRLISAATEIADAAYDAPEDVQGVLDWAESVVFDIAQRREASEMQDWQEWMVDAVAELSKLEPRDVAGVETGFRDLDALLGGLQASNLVILGARPSMGKTSLALNIANHVAAYKRLPVLMFSLEMSSREIMLRMLASEAHLDSSRLRGGYGTVSEWDRADATLKRLGDPPFFINDNPMASVLDMRAQARRLKAQGGLGLVVVDYLQLMSPPKGSKGDNRVQEVSQISRGLKILARELDVPVLALSQLSRALESRDNKRPMLSDLRESGSIEQDADVVMFLYREDAYQPDRPTNMAELIIAKHRNGPTATVDLSFTARETTFHNLAKDENRGW